MHTNEERIRLVHKRTTELKQKKEQKKRCASDVICMVACLFSVVGIGAFMPTLMADMSDGGAVHASGVASLIADNTALGYILTGLLAFLLGVCVTVLLYRLRRKSEQRHKGDNIDEL